MTLNVGSFLTRRALLEPGKVGLIMGEQRLTFSQMNRRANRLAHALAARGVKRGDRVAALLRNRTGYYDLYYGLAKLGAIFCGINWRLAPPEIAFILEDSGARFLVLDAEFEPSIRQTALPPTLKGLAVVGADGDSDVQPYEELVSEAADEEPPIAGEASDSLLLMYTSGTTGRPKGVLLNHQQMFWCSATAVYSLDHRKDDVNLLPLPLYHIGGMSFVTIYVHIGATAILIPSWDPGKVLELIERERVNHFMAVPAMLDALLNHPRIDEVDLSSLRWLLVAAAPVPAELIQAYAARGILVQQSYGLTETAGPATFLGADMALEKAGSAGTPFFHTEVRVVDIHDNDVAPGEVGEVWIRGPHIFTEYWRKEQATAEAFVGDWFRSGDLARYDEDGYLFIVDRLKDMIISGGENIYPAEVENVLYSHPKIAEVAVVGAPDRTWGETVCAIAVLKPDQQLTLEELRRFCEGKIARYKMPRKLLISPEPLARNPTGKLLKNLLRRQLDEAPDSLVTGA